jgi:SAM-dependent methyltransferase
MRTLPPGLFGESYYSNYYPDHDRKNTPRKLAYYREIVARFLPAGPERPRVLDLGCAFGSFVAALDPRWRAYGADLSEFAIARARQLVPGATFEVIREGMIPFAETFDAITAWDVLEHIPDLDTAATQIRDRLVVGGIVAFAVPVYDGPLGPLVDRLDKDVTHINRFRRRFWLDLAQRHFDVVEWTGAFRYLLPGGYYVHWTTHALRHVSPAIVIVGRRRAEAELTVPKAESAGARPSDRARTTPSPG